MIEKAAKFKYPHGFSTRIGGVSEGIYKSLNLGMNRGDDEKRVIQNWNIFRKECGVENEAFVCGNQIHSNIVHVASSKNLRPAYGPGKLIDADGYVTNERDVALSVFTADCVPVLLEDSVSGVVGAVHAGWRGAVADIEGSAIEKMLSLGSDVANIKVAIGPAICKCCFEVGAEVIEAVGELIGKDAATKFYDVKDNGKFMLDLRGVVRERFIQLGILPNNIEFVGDCTMCNPDKYFSHRYSNGYRGSLACLITIL